MIGYTYYDDFQRYVYFDPASDTIAKQIRNVFAKNDLQATLWDWDSKKQRYLVAVVGTTSLLNIICLMPPTIN